MEKWERSFGRRSRSFRRISCRANEVTKISPFHSKQNGAQEFAKVNPAGSIYLTISLFVEGIRDEI
jgi:hypothetical protein